jgi:hypothetical protein
MLDKLSNYYNNSTFLIAVVLLMMNICGGYIKEEIPDYMDDILNTPILRRFIIFIFVLSYTKDIATSIIVTLLFIILFSYLLNNKSRYCILSEKLTNKNKITEIQYLKAAKTVQKFLKENKKISI